MNIFLLTWILIPLFSPRVHASSDSWKRPKRQGVQFGFGLPNFQHGGGVGFAIPAVDGQAIGGAFNSLLQGFLGSGQQHGRPAQQANCDKKNGGCQHVCRFIRGRVECGCNPGFFLGQDRKSCADIDECQGPQRPCQEICTNTAGSYTCDCTAGRAVRADGSCQAAIVSNSCAQNNGGCQQTCTQRRRGAIRCTCLPGYVLNPDRTTCADIDECASGFHDCGELLCVNTVGDYDCTARSSLPVISDPCLTNNGGCHQICINKQGNVECQCQIGFQLVSGNLCAEITTTTTTTTTTSAKPPPPPVDLPVTSAPPPIEAPVTPAISFPPVIISTTLPPSESGCGVNTKKSLFVRIVGGKPADPKDWPWMAALLRATEGSQFCGGTLITDRHVLTAAHCVVSFTSKELRVRLGEYSFATPDENSPTDFKVDEIRKHNDYDTSTQENDIAVLKLDRVIAFSEFIWPACLPPPDNRFEDQLGYVTGWGSIFFGGPVSSVLQEVIIPVWKHEDCVAAYPENKVTNSMMCCGRKTGGVDSCQGDSGGPFLIQIFPGKRWYVAGVVSWGIECASPNRPGVYTRVNHYLDWIKDNAVP